MGSAMIRLVRSESSTLSLAHVESQRFKQSDKEDLYTTLEHSVGLQIYRRGDTFKKCTLSQIYEHCMR
jgi:hypothetical protein